MVFLVFLRYSRCRCRHSAVGRLGDWTVRAVAMETSLFQTVRIVSGPHPASYSMWISGLSQGVKRPVCEVDNSPKLRISWVMNLRALYSFLFCKGTNVLVFTLLFFNQPLIIPCTSTWLYVCYSSIVHSLLGTFCPFNNLFSRKCKKLFSKKEEIDMPAFQFIHTFYGSLSFVLALSSSQLLE